MTTIIGTRDQTTIPDRIERARVRDRPTAYWLSGALLVVAALGSMLTFFRPELLRGPAVMNGSLRGTVLVILVVVLPLLAVSMVFAARGSLVARVVWLGALFHLVYNGYLLTAETPFNQLFFFYVATLSLSVWSVIVVLSRFDVEPLGARLIKVPARAIATFIFMVLTLNALAWLRGAIPGVLSSSQPAFVVGTGLTTNPLYVIDFAFTFPVMATAAILLWRRRNWGYLLSGMVLMYVVTESLGVAVDQWMGSSAEPGSTVASAAAAPIFAVVALIGLVPLYLHLRHLDGGPAI
jgi:hypothetical protein